MDPDELYTLRNYYWLGSFQQAINEGTSLTRCPKDLGIEKKEFIMRSYIGLGQYDLVISETKNNEELQSVYWLAMYFKEGSGYVETCINELNKINNGVSKSSSLMQGLIYMNENDLKASMKCFQVIMKQSLEAHSHFISLLLKMDRGDLAVKESAKMKQIDEDSSLTLLSEAWIILASSAGADSNSNNNNNKLSYASNIFEDLKDKFGSSPLLLNGIATAKMHLNEHEEAESILLQALTTNSTDANTLANLIVISHKLRKPSETINRYLSQLKTVNALHPLLISLGQFESAFDRMAGSL